MEKLLIFLVDVTFLTLVAAKTNHHVVNALNVMHYFLFLAFNYCSAGPCPCVH